MPSDEDVPRGVAGGCSPRDGWYTAAMAGGGIQVDTPAMSRHVGEEAA